MLSRLLLLLIFVPLPGFSQEMIRVSLGTFFSGSIRGTDLLLQNKKYNESELSFACNTDTNNNNFILINGKTKITNKLVLRASGGFTFFNKKPYRGKLVIHSLNGECLVVNILDLEKYIAGLLNKEMLPSWPLEALKAQAVAARTYALYQREQNKKKLYDIESTTQDQVYDGAGAESAKSHIAVNATRGLALLWRNHPVKAFYHANCGGQTESPEAVWGYKYGYFKSVVCPFHKKPENQKNWALRLNVGALEHSLRKISGLLPQNFIRVAGISPGEENRNHRLNSVIVSDISGRQTKISSNTFRNAIGNTKIKSTAFEIKRNGAALMFEGTGNGHGVGMCQVGAKVMAVQGKKFRTILNYYYPLAMIGTLK